MFGRHSHHDDNATELPLRCSFCNKGQDDVRKLIAGPKLFICDQCVAVCVDIIADDARAAGAGAGAAEVATPPGPRWASSARCTLCRMPVVVEEALAVPKVALLCEGCVAAILAAAAEREDGMPSSEQT